MNPSTYKMKLDDPSPDVLFFPFSEGCVLFRQGTRRIWALNQTAAIFWCFLDEIDTVEGLAQRAAENYGVTFKKAFADAGAVTDFFVQEGLLGNAAPASEEVQETSNLVSSGIPVPKPESSAAKRFFNLPGHILELTCLENVSASLFDNLMGHLQCEAPNTTDINPDSSIWVVQADKDDRWNVALNGELHFENLVPEEILPHLFLLTFFLATRALQDRLLFHGAVLAKNDRAVIFPAEVGSGKTTLAALLAHKGYCVVSDELVVLEKGETGRVFPFTMPMSIKPGSVPVLADMYPELSSAPVFSRSDSKQVRYLMPPRDALAGLDDSYFVAALVFPSYGPGNKTELQTMDKLQALNRLAATGSSDRMLTENDIRTMISLVEERPCYTLNYSDAGDAVSLLEQKVFNF